MSSIKWAAANQYVSVAVQGATLALLIAFMDANHLAVYYHLLAWIYAGMVVVDYGFFWSEKRRIASMSDLQHRNGQIRVAIASQMIIGLLTIPILGTLATQFPISDADLPVLQDSLIWFVVATSLIQIQWLFESVGQFKAQFYLTVLPRAIQPLLLIVIWTQNEDDLLTSHSAILTFGIVNVISLITSMIFWLRISRNGEQPSWAQIKQTVTNGWPFFLSSTSTIGYSQLVPIWLGLTGNSGLLVAYSLGDRFRKLIVAAVDPIIKVTFREFFNSDVAPIKIWARTGIIGSLAGILATAVLISAAWNPLNLAGLNLQGTAPWIAFTAVLMSATAIAVSGYLNTALMLPAGLDRFIVRELPFLGITATVFCGLFSWVGWAVGILTCAVMIEFLIAGRSAQLCRRWVRQCA